MKYIRTKDEVREFSERFNLEHYRNCGFNDEDIVRKFIRNGNKIGDTIEELCDCFSYGVETTKDISVARGWNINGRKIYGCILTDKGIIYITKPMTKEGKFELL